MHERAMAGEGAGAQYFVGIGGQKCGTAWLGKYLYGHPDVLDHPVKEMHVFDRLLVPEYALPAEKTARRAEHLASPHRRAAANEKAAALREILEIVASDDPFARYRAYFERRLQPHHRAFGELTPAYALLDAAGFSTIRSVYPGAKMIFVLRDPVDRLWSHVRQAFPGDPAVALARFDECVDRDVFTLRSRYERTLEALDASVPAEDLLTLFYEDLFDPTDDRALRQVTNFLAIAPRPVDRSDVVHRGAASELPADAQARAARALNETYVVVRERFGRLPARWEQRLARSN